MATILWHIELSHYSEKVRWALDYKGIPYEARVPMPGLHGMRALMLTRGAQRRLPVADIEGRRVGDSTAIIAALEEHRPEPALYPADEAQRRRALALEDHFDEHLGPAVRRFGWFHNLQDTDAMIDALFTGGAPPARERLLRATAPVAARFVRADYGVSDESATRAREEMLQAMDRIEAELGTSGYLAGDAFSVADLTASALFTPILGPPQRPYLPAHPPAAILELREELSARPGGRYVLEMYARHRTRAAAPVGA